MASHMTVEDIKKLIPHRYPMLMVDRILSIDTEEGHIVGLKNVSTNEPFFEGHFPREPIMPGVMIVEAMAQTSAVLVNSINKTTSDDSLFYFMSIEKAKFRHPVVPGDSVKLTIKKERQKASIWVFTGEATVGDTKVAQAEFMAKVIDR